MTRLVGLAFALLLVAVPALADPEECRDAVDSYNEARSDIATALNRYASCVSDSGGHDDCSGEFMALQSAQDDFESAVSNYESECQ